MYILFPPLCVLIILVDSVHLPEVPILSSSSDGGDKRLHTVGLVPLKGPDGGRNVPHPHLLASSGRHS